MQKRSFEFLKFNSWLFFQGGLDEELRKECARELIERDTPGFAIGGLSGGEEKDKFWRQVSASTEVLPKDKPRYLMGVGFALDLVVCSALGVDMYDCVYPTRTARFGNALTMTHPGSLNIRSKIYRKDFRPIGNVQLWLTSWQFCTLDGVLMITHKIKRRILLTIIFLEKIPWNFVYI